MSIKYYINPVTQTGAFTKLDNCSMLVCRRLVTAASALVLLSDPDCVVVVAVIRPGEMISILTNIQRIGLAPVVNNMMIQGLRGGFFPGLVPFQQHEHRLNFVKAVKLEPVFSGRACRVQFHPLVRRDFIVASCNQEIP